jgi:hypothetical protein
MHCITYMHLAPLTVTDEQLQPLRSNQQCKVLPDGWNTPRRLVKQQPCQPVHAPPSYMSYAVHWNVTSHLPQQVSGATATDGQLVTSERGVCGGPLAFNYANSMSYSAFRQSLACFSLL